MSLINRMLQDLEQRSTDGLREAGVSPQIKVVPGRGTQHAAWWLVAVLALSLAGVVAWLWLRPPAVIPSEFELKLASRLAALPSPAEQAPLSLDTQLPLSPPLVTKSADTKPYSLRTDDTLAAAPREINSPAPENVPPASKPDMPSAKTSDATVGKKLPAAAASVNNDNGVRLEKQVKELTPSQRAENAYRSAGVALQQGHQQDAIADLEQALQFDPRHAAARQMLVGLLLQAKRTDDAARLAQDGLATDPAQVGLAMILARVQVEQGNGKTALETLEHSLPYAGDRADYQAFIAALLQREKRNKEAIEHYVLALGKSPQNGVWWMGLGISLQAENRVAEAKEAYSRAKSSDSLTPELVSFVNQKLAQLK